MSKRKYRRRVRRLVRLVVLACLVIGFMSWGLGWTGMPISFLVLGTLGALLVIPAVLLALVVTTAAVATPFAIVAAIFGAPFYLIHRLTRGAGSASRDADDDADAAYPARAVHSEEALLRRRYVAGELTYQQFQTGMVGLLKERFARGDLRLTEYEAELEKLLQPARHLDAARDPALAAAVRP
jgi:hypothetical protein